MKILVTGGAGFIGSHIVDKLIKNGYDVVVIDNLSTGKLENLHNLVTYYQIDIRDRRLVDIFDKEKPEIVIHEAAQINIQKSIDNPVLDADINILGTINLLEACRKNRVYKVIYASSAAIYGNPEYLGVDENHKVSPISYYGISKYTPHYYIRVYNQLYGLNYCILCYSNVYGIRQDPNGEGGVVSIFMDMMLKGKNPIIFGDGEQTRDFIYVDDVANANILAIKNGDNEVINIGTGEQTSVNNLFDIMNDIFNATFTKLYKEERNGDIKHSYFDNSKAKKILYWEPDYDLRKGLTKTIKYYEELLIYNKT